MIDFLVVGCGLAGMTTARILADYGCRILIIDKRDHIGGNIYDYYNNDGILIHKYGPHIFHTNNERVWTFISRFTKWRNYQHKVLAYINGRYVPLPININTINLLYHKHYNTDTIEEFFNQVKINIKEINNSKDVIISQVGEELYQLFFEKYTKKQWGLYPNELNKEVTGRIPVRRNYDNRYFTDIHQGIPLNGYTKMAQEMLHHSNITVLLNTNYLAIKNQIKCRKIIFTGCIDDYFDNIYGRLSYRSLHFEEETYDKEFYQKAGVVNYPNDFPFTRITEYKYLTGQKCHKTTIVKEFPCAAGEPYYPIPRDENQRLYKKYRKIDTEGNVFFAGRLGTYSYLNMDEVIVQAMDLCKILSGLKK